MRKPRREKGDVIMGRTYVMSDIHGMAELLERMLRKISFSPEDTLYILGDMIDRGPDPAGVIELAASRENIVALKGNHEDMFAEWYEYTADKSEGYFYNTYRILMSRASTREKLPEYVRWMKKLPLYKKVKIKDTCYILAHASTQGVFELWKKKDMFLWESEVTGDGKSFPGYISIVGHVPAFILRGYPKEPAAIWRRPDGKLLDIDCGAAFPEHGGRLACLCLETGEEFYVSAADVPQL